LDANNRAKTVNKFVVNKNDVLDILRRHEEALRSRGVVHAALFGSLARGEARPDSDVDILIKLDSSKLPDVFQYAGLTMYIEQLFPSPVDVVDLDALRPSIRGRAESEAIYAF
jgi:predicted nucleotidyltransferase